MPLARAYSIALVGVEGHTVEVEADIANGLVGLLLVGLPDTALREARDRIRSAIANSDQEWPQRKITVGLSPASLPKRGSGFDLSIAVAILAAAGVLPLVALAGLVLLGELGLDGRLRSVRGVLPATASAAGAGFTTVAVPQMNAPEAALMPGVRVLAVPSLAALLAHLRGERCPAGTEPVEVIEGGTFPGSTHEFAMPGGATATGPWRSGKAEADRAQRSGMAKSHANGGTPESRTIAAPGMGSSLVTSSDQTAIDLADVLGQPVARRAVEICAAGGHHLSMLGPPGAGKTMLAERLPTVLPRLDVAASLEVTSVHSVAGVLPPGRPLVTEPPFCGPHHTATKAAIVGGGSGIIRPGAVSLAHLGVLFLDEAPEFSRDVLDALRQPLESGEVVVARAGLTARFPARFTLVLAANPCPCARGGGPKAACVCTPMARRRYLGRLSGPLLDRVDVKVELLPVGRAELLSDRRFAESSATVAKRVELARERVACRLAGTPWRLNAQIPGSELRRRFRPAPGALARVERAVELGQISARGVDRVLRVSWTLADLAGKARPTADETGYALGLWLGVTQ
ncbi:MAG TPA: ATP-binding protein [Streptosporangiaceae bacterium]|nr:ATP-binding protein [Streptosporangiaceae bacterium]